MTNQKLLEKFFEAENARDWETYRGCLHPDVMWFLHTETTHTPIAGREEYMDRIMTGYKSTSAQKAFFVCERMDVSESGNRIVAFLRNSGGGRSIDVFDFEDCLIRWEHEFLLD